MRIISALPLALAVAVPAPSVAAHQRPVGQETTISFAGGGGLRNWQAESEAGDVVYVQDRQLNWYRIALTGPCARSRSDLTLVYSTDATGTFDRFSHVSLPQSAPDATCGVVSIKTSLPPKGQPGYKP